jgi:hypothetical protein
MSVRAVNCWKRPATLPETSNCWASTHRTAIEVSGRRTSTLRGRAHAAAEPQLDEHEALTLRKVPLAAVRDLLLSARLGQLSDVAGIGLALTRLNK